MADRKISQLNDGVKFEVGDEAVVNRSGANFKVDPTVGFVQTTDLGTDPNQVPLNQYLGSMAYQDLDAVSITGGTATLDGLAVDTNTLYVDAANNRVGIGTSLPSDYNASANNLVVGTTSGSNGITIATGSTNQGSLFFADGTGTSAEEAAGYLIYVHSSNSMAFGTSNTEAMRIDSNGHLLVGATSATISNEMVYLLNDGRVGISAASDIPLTVNRKTDVGDIISLRKDQVVVGSIGTVGDDLTIGTGDVALRFQDGSDNLVPHNVSSNSTRDAAINLGTTGARFKDLYLSGGVYLGGTAAANLLDDYEEGTWTPTIAGTSSAGSHTYTTQTGYYVKIGEFVHLQFKVELSAKGSMTGAIVIGGVPFTGGTITDATSVNFVKYGNLSATVDQVYLQQRPGAFGQYRIYFFTPDGAGGATIALAANANITNTTLIEGTISYRVG